MTAISGTTAFRSHRAAPVARPACRRTIAVRAAMPPAAELRRAMEMAAGTTARFVLALLPVSALAGMFVWL